MILARSTRRPRICGFVRARPLCATLVRYLGPVHRRAGERQGDARTTITSGSTESMKIASFRSRPRSTWNVFSVIVGSYVRPQKTRRRALAALAPGLLLAGVALGGCASGPSGSSSGHATAQDLLALNRIQDASGIKTRDLLPEEKQVISKAVSLSIVDPGHAQYRWPQIADTEDGSINYCGMVNARSSFPAYNGWQAYIVEGTISGGKMTSAVVGLIAGGKDVEIVKKMCKKYGLDPGGAG